MAALGRQLECGVMSIYGYFDNKDDLIAALTQEVMRDFVRQLPPPGDGPWRDEVINYFSAYRHLMDTYTAYRELALYAPAVVLGAAFTPAQLRRLDTGIGLFIRVGLTIEDAISMYNVCLNYTRSFVAFEHGMRKAAGAAKPDSARPHQQFPAATYPVLSRLDDIAPLFHVDTNSFATGLEILVDGIVAKWDVAPAS
jgi:AcrR family transcriptional regulator